MNCKRGDGGGGLFIRLLLQKTVVLNGSVFIYLFIYLFVFCFFCSAGLTLNFRKRAKKVPILASDSTSSVLDKRKNKREKQTLIRSDHDIQKTDRKDEPAAKEEAQGVHINAIPHEQEPSSQQDEQMEVDEIKSKQEGR